MMQTAGPSAIQDNSPYGSLLKALEAEVLQKWKDPEPDPPFAGVEYADIESLYGDIDAAMPGMRESIDQALEDAKTQANSVMEAWGQKDFDKARRSLRMLLLCDPQRRRILQADRDIAAAARWLARVRGGARKAEAFLDYITQVELEGRELRNHVGSAAWLDMILDAFKQLRNQARPADLLMGQPELLTAAPWLNEYRAQETITLPHSAPLKLERGQKPDPDTHPLMGTHHSRLGPGEEIALADPADVWAPEAIGSSARVFNAEILTPTGRLKNCVLKILRPDKAEYALPLFQEEAKILTLLKDVDGANRLLECGFVKLNNGSALPGENQRKGTDSLHGNLQRFGINEVQSYLSSIEKVTADGWLPYLALEKLDPKHNLMLFCDYGHTRGRFLPLRESLVLALQICDILQIAHDRNIAYRDHKILHYYWDEGSQAVTMIDWNIAKRYPQGLSPADRQFDIVQFGARALHHILTGRAAPGSLPMGANLVQEIEQAAHTYQTQWTYDDERLPQQVKDILERVLLEGYMNIRELRQDLHQVFMQIPEQQA
jgi:serine/threonine protein kinase